MTVDPKNLKKIAERGTQDIAFCITRQPNSSTLFVGNSSFQVVALQTDAEKPEFQPLTGESHQSYVTGITVGGDSGMSRTRLLARRLGRRACTMRSL